MTIDVTGLPVNASVNLAFDEEFVLPGTYNAAVGGVMLRFVGSLQEMGGRYALNLEAEGMVSAVCDFCLKPVEQPIAFTVSEIFNKNVSENEDVWVFSGGMVDISESLRMNLLLNFPTSFVCKEGCMGLCPKCGQNLNERACGCQPSHDPRFDVLSLLKFEGM